MFASLRQTWNTYRLLRQLAVPQWALRDAQQSPPVPAEGAWAPTETTIGKRFDERANTILAEREEALKPHRVAAIDNQLAGDERVFPGLVQTTKAAIYAMRLRLNTAWAQVRASARRRYKDLQDFKRQNLLTHRDAVHHPINLAIGICAIAFVGETAVNATLFAEVSAFGLAGGALNAMTLSIPNIILGLAAGFWGLRARQHIHPLIHYMGTIVTALSLTLALAWNFYVGHLRIVAEHLSHSRQELRLSDLHAVRAQILDDPLAPFASSQAVVLMFVGLVVVAIALWDGLDGFSDRYPGFSRMTRRHERELRKVAAVKRKILREVKHLTRKGIRSVKRQRHASNRITREALHILDGARATIICYESKIDHAFSVHSACLRVYQETNAKHRDQVPARFTTLDFPSTRATRPVYDWQGARAEIQTRAQHVKDAAATAITELQQHRLDIMAAVEAEASQVTNVPVLLPPPPLLTYVPRPA